MSTVGAFVDRKEQPSLVRFERVAVEDKGETRKVGDGVVKYRDEDYVLVTPPYSKDVFRQRAVKWFAQMRIEVEKGRLPRKWFELYEESYKRWQRNEEMPLNGTPIKSWPALSPSQVKMLVSLNILTVESLAAVNDEGLRRIGMGGVELKNKAVAWLAQANDKGPLTHENAALKEENVALKARVSQLEARVNELAAKVINAQPSAAVEQPHQESAGISAGDILEQPEAPKRGRPKKQVEQAEAPL